MTEASTLRLDLPLILPDVEDVQDRCVTRLVDALAGRPGIAEAHIVGLDAGSPQLCVHYQPEILPLARVRELVQSVGAQLTARFAHLVIRGDATLHARAARSVAEGLRGVPGVLEADVSAAGAVRIEYDRECVSEGDLRAKLKTLGVAGGAALPDTAGPFAAPAPAPHGRTAGDPGDPDMRKTPLGRRPREEAATRRHDHAKGGWQAHGEHDHANGGLFGERTELIFAALAGALLAAGWLLEQFGAAPSWAPNACYVTAYFFGGYFTFKEAIDNLRARRFEIDTLMLVAAVGAAALGAWAEGALLLFLFSLGHSLEHYAMGRARKAIEALAKLAPETATVRRDGRPWKWRSANLAARRRRDRQAQRTAARRRLRGGRRHEAASTRRRSPARACQWTSGPPTTPRPHSPRLTNWAPSSVFSPAPSTARAPSR